VRIKKRNLVLLFAVLIAIAAGWRFLQSPTDVQVVRPRKREVAELVIASGRLRAIRQSDLGAEVAGIADTVTAVEGDRVHRGQVLITLREADAQRQSEQARLALETARRTLEQVKRGPLSEEISRAQADLERQKSARELAEKDFERSSTLQQKGVLAKSEADRYRSTLDQARAAEQSAFQSLQILVRQPLIEDLRVAEARVREAEASVRLWDEQLQKRTILSPADGLIVKRQVEPGQSVVPGNVLLTLSLMDRMEIYVETDENNLRKLRIGQKALVVAPSYQDQSLRATLTQIGPEVDNKRGVIGLRLLPESLPAWVQPDMTMDANIEVARFHDAMSVPITALLEQEGDSFVMEVRGGRAQRRPVRVLGRNAEWVALEGVDPGVLVVVQATEVQPNQSVRVKEIR
jgi:HlyD family secretion protein